MSGHDTRGAKAKGGGPAFPLATSSGSNTAVNGMTLRDYFAAKAMHALLTAPAMQHLLASDLEVREPLGTYVVPDAYVIADTMLRVRKAPVSTS